MYSDASRIKMYLSLGVPVIASGVPELQADIFIHNAGSVFGRYNSYVTELEIRDSVLELMDPARQQEKAWNAYKLAEKYLADNIFSEEFEFLCSRL